MLNSGIPGISMPLDAGAEQPQVQTIILGCTHSWVKKYEKGPNDQAWALTGELRLEQNVLDVL